MKIKKPDARRRVRNYLFDRVTALALFPTERALWLWYRAGLEVLEPRLKQPTTTPKEGGK